MADRAAGSGQDDDCAPGLRHAGQRRKECTLLDGDEVRTGLCSDLGFTDADRLENVRRVAEVARLMVDAGVIVVAALVSPSRVGRERARARFAPRDFIEVFIDVPLSVAESRDPKGHYARARQGRLPNFTGIGSPYEAPTSAEIRIEASLQTPAQSARIVIEYLMRLGLLE